MIILLLRMVKRIESKQGLLSNKTKGKKMKSKLLWIMIIMSMGLSASDFRQLKSDCANNIGSSCYSLAYIYVDEKDMNSALETFKKGCELNHVKSCVGAGAIASEIGDGKQIEKYYKEACDKGSNLGCEFLGDYYYKQGLYKKAIPPLKKTCYSSKKQKETSCRKLADISNELNDANLKESILSNCMSKGPSSLSAIRINKEFCATTLNLEIKAMPTSPIYPIFK